MLSNLKLFRIVFFSFLCLSLSIVAPHSNAQAAGALKPLDYKTFSKKVANAKGKVLVVNFFATWCPPCKAEMPELQRISQKFPADKLEFFAVSVDEDIDAVQPFLKKMGVTFPVFLCEPDLAEQLNISAIPRTLIYDRAGKLALDAEGMMDEEDLNEQVGKLIGK